MKLKLNITQNDLETRSCDDEMEKVEIIKWLSQEPRHCYTLAIFRKGKEGYDLGFIGARPFQQDINHEDFWQLAHMTQVILDEFFDKNKSN